MEIGGIAFGWSIHPYSANKNICNARIYYVNSQILGISPEGYVMRENNIKGDHHEGD
jgi:hypothetical protein